jgi:recombinational DNA repair protein (RecF pathway)
MRECSHCHKQLTPQELAKEESKGMEAERKALGLRGIRFLFYNCSDCGYADIFVDVHPVTGETVERFRQRRRELESTVRQLHAERVEIVVTDR